MNLALYTALAAAFAILFLLERVIPGRRDPFDASWYIRAVTVNVVQLAILVAIATLLNPWLSKHSLFHVAAQWPKPVAGLAVAILGSLIQYGWHRAEHANNYLWRTFHQIHHSPSRIDILTTNYAHPLDYIVNTTIHSVAGLIILGVDAEGMAWSVFIYGVNNYFAHCNLQSPRWLGYLMQRPEMHRIHHKFEHHHQNYGFPMWDMLFGTWINPPVDEDFKCGFEGRREHMLAEMLVGQDVNPPKEITPDPKTPKTAAMQQGGV